MKESNFSADRFTFTVDTQVMSFLDERGFLDDVVYLKNDGKLGGAGAVFLMDGHEYRGGFEDRQRSWQVKDELDEAPRPVATLTDATKRDVVIARDKIAEKAGKSVRGGSESRELAVAMEKAVQKRLGELGYKEANTLRVISAVIEQGEDDYQDIVLRPTYVFRINTFGLIDLVSLSNGTELGNSVRGDTLLNLSEGTVKADVAEMAKIRPYAWLLDERSPLFDSEAYSAVAAFIASGDVAEGLTTAVERDLEKVTAAVINLLTPALVRGIGSIAKKLRRNRA